MSDINVSLAQKIGDERILVPVTNGALEIKLQRSWPKENI